MYLIIYALASDQSVVGNGQCGNGFGVFGSMRVTCQGQGTSTPSTIFGVPFELVLIVGIVLLIFIVGICIYCCTRAAKPADHLQLNSAYATLDGDEL